MKHDIKNRHTGEVQFTADIDCDPETSDAEKMGLAVRWAVKNNVNLTGADLTNANLTGADLSCADLRVADLLCADLTNANLTGADLCSANLTGADLTGTGLAGADLTGAKGILRIGPSADGYEFYGVVRDGEVWIKAGCRWFSAADARTH